MNYSHGDWLDYDEVEKIKQYFDIKDVKHIGCNNEGIIVDFSYNNRMYDYQRLTNTTFNEDQLSNMQMLVTYSWDAECCIQKSIDIEIRDLETMIDITAKPPYFVEENSPTKETLKDWVYIDLIFRLIMMHVDDADGCKHLESLSYQDFKDDPKVKSIINMGILQACEMYIETINDNCELMQFQKDWVRDGIYTAYYLIKMNHPLMEMIKKYPEYKPRFCTVVEVARQLGLHEEQLIISDFTASIQDSPDKWEL